MILARAPKAARHETRPYRRVRAGTLYCSSRWAGARGIFTSQPVHGAYTEPVPLESVLGPDAGFPFVAPDGSYLLFVRGMQDVHVSFRDAGGQWGPPIALGAGCNGIPPVVSPDGKFLFVGRGPQTFWADTSVIEKKRPK